MRYVARKADDSVNVSKQHLLVEASTLTVGLTLIFVTIAFALILLVDLLLLFVSPEKEADMFRSWLPDDIVTVAEDGEHLPELRALTERLAMHWDDSQYEFRVEITESDDLNAMALPGGLIIVTSSLLGSVESENELALILGHEMGHFRNRDHIRGLGRGVVLAIFFAAISGSDGGANLGMSIGDLALRGFSRRQEADADEFGLLIVHKEYGHVADSWRFFERINDDDDGLSNFAQYLSTHPSPDDRVADLVETAGANGWPIRGNLTPLAW